MTKAVGPNTCPSPQPTITETTSHKQSMLYFLQLEIQEIHFQNAIHFNILVSTGIAHGANYKALLEIFLLESLK